jgi:hypothetical protein
MARSPGSQRPSIIAPFPEQTGQVGAAWIPWAALNLDDRPMGASPPAELDTGRGFSIRGGRYDDALGVEGVLAVVSHDEERSGAELTMYAAYADLSDRLELWRGPIAAWAGLGVGFGLARFDWDRGYKSELTGLWQVEGIGALQIGPAVSLEARAIGFLAAHPTNTVGTGGMLMLGGSVAF